MLYRFDGKEPVIGAGAYVSETALLIGAVRIGEGLLYRPWRDPERGLWNHRCFSNGGY
jgi:hypothetical protein